MVDVVAIVTKIALTGATWLIALIFIGGLCLGLWFGIGYWKRWKYKVVIFEKDGLGNAFKTSDVAGIFVDWRTNNKRLFLKKANVGLNADNVPFIPDEKGKKCIYLARTGLKNFRFLSMNMLGENDFKIVVGEEDTNWAINAYQRSKSEINNNRWKEYLPWIGLVFVGIIFLVLMIYMIQKFGVFTEVSQNLVQVSQNVKEMAQALNAAKSGTTIVP